MLMLEEVVSSLRSMHPISSDTLTFVADHIRSVTVHSNMISLHHNLQYQSVPLQFVYGAEQSLNIFIEVSF